MNSSTRTAIIILTVGVATTATAGTAAFDRAMAPIVGQYETIHKALAADSSAGVIKAARRIAKLTTKLDPSGVTGKHAMHFRGLPARIKAAALKLSKVKAIAAQREAFKALSRPLAMWATMSKPRGINVLYCSMSKGSWLQRDKVVANPYYGAKMLRCGEIVSGQHKGHASGHMAR